MPECNKRRKNEEKKQIDTPDTSCLAAGSVHYLGHCGDKMLRIKVLLGRFGKAGKGVAVVSAVPRLAACARPGKAAARQE